jgi:HK97 gp10 family phage protein
MNKQDVREQIQQLQADMQKKIEMAKKDQLRFVTLSCAEVERTAKTLMRDSVTNPDVTYGKKGHHPSYPGNAPAPDSGTLLQSVTHSIDVDGKGNVTGYVGSVLKNPDYPKFLEYGTSKMKPRPWLSAAMIKCQSFMAAKWMEIFGK